MSLQAVAAQRVPADQLLHLVESSKGKSDAETAKLLADLELTERLTPATTERLMAGLPGQRARQALTALADASAFLEPPTAEIPATATPDAAAQRRILAQTVNYVGKMLPLLPNMFATRDTTRFENRPSPGLESSSENPLHQAGMSSVTVLYRDGREFVAAGETGGKPQLPDKGLTTWGEFGPILGTVLIDAARNTLAWSHWELSASGPQAVFRYSVPREKSHYDVRFCCIAESYGLEINEVRQRAGYHGEITVDPIDGSIRRLTVEADLEPGNPIARAAIAVEYGPVEIGGKTYLCPVRGIALANSPDLKALHDMLYPATAGGAPDGPPSLKKTSLATVADVPRQTLLNDIAFSQYHLFRADARVVTDTPGVAAATPVPAFEGAVASDTAPVPESPKPLSAAASGAAAPPASAEPEPPAASVAAPAESAELPEISVSESAGLPRDPTVASSATPGSEFTLHMNSRLVDVSVVALDKKGRPITNLKPEDFEIYDDGRKQEVRSFGTSGDATAAEPAQAAPAIQPAWSNRSTGPAAPGAPEGNTTILLFDAGHLANSDLGNAREQMRRFLKGLHPNDRAALYVMKAVGFQVLQEATTDHGLLDSQLASYRPSAQDQSSAQDEEARNRQKLETVHSVEDLLNVNGNAVNNLDPGTQTEALDVKLRDFGVDTGRDALSILATVARHLAAIPGHKSLVWVTSDNALADWNKMSVSIDKGSKFIEASALRTQEAMNNAHVSVYPLDASVLEAAVIDASIGRRNVELTPTYQMPPAVEKQIEGPEANAGVNVINTDQTRDMGAGRLTAQMQQDLHPIQGAFREVADATGGRIFRRSNDLVSEFNAVEADGRATYLLGFSPDQQADGKYHLITVKVNNRRDVTLRYRTGFQYDKEPASIKDRFLQAVWQPSDVSDIALSANSAATAKGAAIQLNIAANDLAVAQQQDLWADRVDIFLVERDDVSLHARVTGQALNLRLKPATYQRILHDGIPFNQRVQEKPETGSLRIVVVDENSGRMGSVTVPAAALPAKQ
jgi:VWFA-related protein